MQDRISELHCLLTGQCCLSAQTETSRDSGKRHALPFEHLEVDFTEMKPHRHYHYLVVVSTFSGWVEAFPTQTERASKVAWCLLREIVPRFGFPISIGLDNGPAFIAGLVQVSKTLNIKWKLHTAYRPQSSGMVEGTNLILKRDTLQVGHRA